MQDKIEIGEYIKLDDGTIGKYNINKNHFNVVETNNRDIGFNIDNDVIKHSKDIIDLIEIGDYVNGMKVESIIKTDKEHLILEGQKYCIYSENIKTIVTKEMFVNMEYKVGV